MKNGFILCLLMMLTSSVANAQEADWSANVGDLKAHVYELASDEYEGRATGTDGEIKAASYIEAEFKKLKLTPKGDDHSFIQHFSVLAGKNFGEGNYLNVNKAEYKLNEAYYPLEISGNGQVSGKLVHVGQGIDVPDEGHNDYEGLKKLDGAVFLIETSSPKPAHPHAALVAFQSLRKKVEVAESKGASAVIFINSDETAENPTADYSRKVAPFDIPVIFFTDGLVLKEGKKRSIELGVELIEDRRPAKNVLAYLDNGAELTIIVGGHYDHIGYGDFGSRYLGTERLIHNGADDNASGTSMILELADRLVTTGFDQANVLFICFSGEEMGL
ncbi:MAG: M28 family peptidase, partial [Bacteroidota bacterium]